MITLASVSALTALLFFHHEIGWELTWRSFGVVPLQPHFFDMHAVTDHAACMVKGFNAYVLTSCYPITPFNYPPIWLWLGYVRVDGTDSAWLSILMTTAALAVTVRLLSGRSVIDGAYSSAAILSPSMMMAAERGNIDLAVYTWVAISALLFVEHKPHRIAGALVILLWAVILKLHPIFCISLIARFSRRTFYFVIVLAASSLAYFAMIFDYISIIRENTPNTPLLSYGYRVAFLSLDQLLTEARLSPSNLPNTWVPLLTALATASLAAGLASASYRHRRRHCAISNGAAGTAFLFGAGIYCGSFMLGTNFTYRLMYLLLCVPQLQDWKNSLIAETDRTPAIAELLLLAVLGALWVNGNPIFLFLGQAADWLLFGALGYVMALNLLNSCRPRPPHTAGHLEQ